MKQWICTACMTLTQPATHLLDLLSSILLSGQLLPLCLLSLVHWLSHVLSKFGLMEDRVVCVDLFFKDTVKFGLLAFLLITLEVSVIPGYKNNPC